jgi:hypothetical protein
MAWRDAKGTFVGPAVTRSVALHFDARGLIWVVDANGQLQTQNQDILYDAADCTGNGYVSEQLPRLVVKVEGDASDTFRTLPDAYTPVKVQVRSARYDSQCSNYDDERDLVPLADTLPATPIVKPAVQFVGPLRLSLQ